MTRRDWLALAAALPIAASTVEVPNVIGLHILHAKARLSDAGLALGRVLEVGSARRGKGVIVDQDPKPFTRVARTAEITLYVSIGVDRPRP